MPRILKPAGIDKEWNLAAEARVIVGCGESKWNVVQHQIDSRVINGRKYWHTAKLVDFLKRTALDIKAAGTPQRIHTLHRPPGPGRPKGSKGKAKAAKGEAREARP